MMPVRLHFFVYTKHYPNKMDVHHINDDNSGIVNGFNIARVGLFILFTYSPDGHVVYTT